VLAGETGGAERSLAVTGLERFAKCAFMGYAHVVLAARETDLKEELPDAREEGTLVHEALAAAFLATRELWSRRPRAADEILAQGTRAAEAILERWQGHAPLRAIVRLRVGDAVRAVLGVAIADETWDFALAEQTFGARDASTWNALYLADRDVHLSLRGSIDRVDRAHDGAALRVVDYKRSKTTVRDAGSSLGGTALQVPLYACIASRELGLPATGSYVPTQARDVAIDAKPSARASQRMDELVARPAGTSLTEIERRALSLAATARAGLLAPIPAHESECRYCAVSGGCRKPRFAMAPVDDADDDGDTGRTARDTP
jgi:RecB family exonuclease